MSTLLLFLLACGGPKNSDTSGETESTDLDRTCDPIAPTLCGLPFPSTFYMVASDTSATGWQINFGEETLPRNFNLVQTLPTYINEKDGFSPLTPAIAHLPDATADGLISHLDIGRYEDTDAKTVIVNLDSGERVPHFAEIDESGLDPDRKMLILHPVEPMEHGGRYAVGIRNVTDSTGGIVAASEGFAALRDGASSIDPLLAERQEWYDGTLFPALESAGFAQSDLQIAWDFVVASREGVSGKSLWMRDDLYDRLGADGPSYVITSIEEDVNESTARRVYGEMTVPLYTEFDAPGTMLNRDADGMPYAEGETTVPFTIIVPRTAVEDPRPLPLIQYGHGLLGSQGEVNNSYLSEFADSHGYILFAVDWTGMKEEDRGPVSLMIVESMHEFSMLPERSQQGFVEFLAAMEMMQGPMALDSALHAPDPEDPDSMIPLIDTETAYYYGNSQGAILGGAYIALSPRIERATLGVGGSPYHILLNRSADFSPFFDLFNGMFEDPLQVQLLLALNQTIWDPGESSGYMHMVNQAPLPDTNAKDVLLQVAIGDAQVTTLGAHVMARGYGAKLIEDPTREVWGLETVASGHEGSALVEFEYGLEEPVENIPPDADLDPHERPRRDLAGQLQMHTFFQTGLVEHFCDGPCGESSD